MDLDISFGVDDVIDCLKEHGIARIDVK